MVLFLCRHTEEQRHGEERLEEDKGEGEDAGVEVEQHKQTEAIEEKDEEQPMRVPPVAPPILHRVSNWGLVPRPRPSTLLLQLSCFFFILSNDHVFPSSSNFPLLTRFTTTKGEEDEGEKDRSEGGLALSLSSDLGSQEL